MARLIGYLRVSTPEQKKKYGFDRQERDIKSYCESHDHQLIGDPMKDYYTGMEPLHKRPEGKQVMELLESGKADGIIFPKVNRLGRGFLDTLQTVKQITRGGWLVYSVD